MMRARAVIVLGVLVSSVLQSAPLQASKPRLPAKDARPDQGASAVPMHVSAAEVERRDAIVRQLAGRWVAPAH